MKSLSQHINESLNEAKTYPFKGSHITFRQLGLTNLKDINDAIKTFSNSVGGWMQKGQGFKFDNATDAKKAYDLLMNDNIDEGIPKNIKAKYAAGKKKVSDAAGKAKTKIDKVKSQGDNADDHL